MEKLINQSWVELVRKTETSGRRCMPFTVKRKTLLVIKVGYMGEGAFPRTVIIVTAPNISFFIFVKWRERERETDTDFDLFYLFMHSLADSCMCRDLGSDPHPAALAYGVVALTN